jgi:hypothetical protein
MKLVGHQKTEQEDFGTSIYQIKEPTMKNHWVRNEKDDELTCGPRGKGGGAWTAHMVDRW